MRDRATLSNLRFQLHDARSEIAGVRSRLPETRRATRADPLERAQRLLLEATDEIEAALNGPLSGDDTAALSPLRFIGVDHSATRQ